MSFEFKIDLSRGNLIQVINSLDQFNVEVSFDKEQIYEDIIGNQNYDLIEFFIDRGEDPLCMFNYCYEDDVDVIRFLIDKHEAADCDACDFMLSALELGLVNTIVEICGDKLKNIFKADNGKVISKAVEMGDIVSLKLFFSLGAKISNCLIDPINEALQNHRIGLIDFLLANDSSYQSITANTLCKCINKRNKSAVKIIEDLIRVDTLKFSQEDTVECMTHAIKHELYGLCINLFNHGPTLTSKQLTHLINVAQEMGDSGSSIVLTLKRIHDKIYKNITN
jgi:hypothetical protein